MYKFTNGMIVYDKELADHLLKMGYVLSVNKKNKLQKKSVNVVIGKVNEAENENNSNNGTVEGKPKECNKLSEQV